MLNKNLLKLFRICLLTILPYIYSSGTDLLSQTDNSKFVDAIIKELKQNKGRTMGMAPNRLLHIYSVEIPDDATVIQREKNFNYEIYPVYITYAHRVGYYKIAKIRKPYDAVIYNEPKQSYASLKETPKISNYETVTIWEYEEQTKEFQKELDGLKNLKDSDFDSIFGPTDNFPDKWKK